MADKFRQIVLERSQALKKVKNIVKIISDNDKVITIKRQYKDFSDQVPISGFRESINSSHWLIRLIWIFLIISGLSLTIFFIVCVISQYQQEPTATKVKLVRKNQYEIPPLYFCLKGWRKDDNLYQRNLSHLGVRYLYSLIEPGTLSTSETQTGKRDLEKFAASNNLSTFSDVFSIGSYQLDQFPTPPMFLRAYAKNASFTIGLQRSCYQVSMTSPPKSTKSGFGVGFLSVDKSSWFFVLIGADHRFAQANQLISLSTGFSYQIRINARSYNALSDPDNRHGDESLLQVNSCTEKCRSAFFEAEYKCRLITDSELISDPSRSVDLCPPSYHNNHQSVNETWLDYIDQKCREQCGEMRQSLFYDYTVTQTVVDNETETSLFFHLLYAERGILSFEETSTYSLQSAVSDVGGQLGLWMGLSIATLVQIVFFFINNIFKPKSTNVDTIINVQ